MSSRQAADDRRSRRDGALDEAPDGPEPGEAAGAFRMVESAAALREVLAELKRAETYGLDTEFSSGRTYYPELALVQLAWPGGIALVDPLAVDVAPLAELLEGPGTAVVHAASQDLVVLHRACGAVPSVLFDPQVAAAFLGLGSPSLATLVRDVLDVKLAKGDQLADWLRRPLGARELDYAASDVAHLLDLHRALVSRLGKRGRLAWAEQECERIRSRPHEDPPLDTAWWRLRGKGKLPTRSFGVAQQVAAWRERTARERNRLPRSVLPDLSLSAVVQRAPRNIEQLRRIRGVEPRHLRNGAGDEILAAVREGLALGHGDVHHPPSRPNDERRHERAVSLGLAWIGQVAEDIGVEPRLLGTREDVTAFARGEDGARIAAGWRHEVVGLSLQRLFDGEVAVACEGERLVLVPVG